MNYDPLQHNAQQRKKRQERPLCRLHYSVMMRILNNPSSSAAFLTENGRASQQSMVNDVARFMYVLVNEMCLTTGKIGVLNSAKIMQFAKVGSPLFSLESVIRVKITSKNGAA